MKIFSALCRPPCRKFPGIYLDKRDGQVTLMLANGNGMVLRAGTQGRRPLGCVGSFSLSEHDVLCDEEFTLKND